MPLPARLGRFNRRVTNRIARVVAGRLPPLAIVVHPGRTTGREYQTPVMIFTSGRQVVVALTYGAQADWVKNVRAQGGCALIHGGRRSALTAPRLVGVREGLPRIPRPLRPILRALGVTEFLVLDRVAREETGAPRAGTAGSAPAEGERP